MNTVQIIVMLYYILIGITAVAMTAVDKRKAQKGKWRIPEFTLMMIGLAGGALPMYITMKKIRHKTKHPKFMVGLPLEIIVHAVLISANIFFTFICK